MKIEQKIKKASARRDERNNHFPQSQSHQTFAGRKNIKCFHDNARTQAQKNGKRFHVD